MNVYQSIGEDMTFSDNITKVAGKHTIKAGFYWDFARNNQTGGGLSDSTQGAAVFDNWGATSTGNPLADWVTGRVTQFSQQKAAPVADFKYNQYSFYVNDQWKMTRRFTLTLGARFEHMGSWYPLSGPGLAVWDQSRYDNTSAAKDWTGLAWNAIDSTVPTSGLSSKPFFVEPRVGAAYDVFGNGKTILRGGLGLYRYQIAYNTVSGSALSAPLNVPDQTTTWGCCVGWNQFNQYSPGNGVAGIGSGLGGILTKGDDATPNTTTYNLTISQRTPWRSHAEFQYSGNRSRDLLLKGPLTNLDNVPVGTYFKPNPLTGVIVSPGDPAFQANDYLPLRNYTSIQLVGHGSYSNYNAFIATWQKQTGKVTFTTNYTFSKVLGVRDNQTDNGAGAGNSLDPYSLRNNYGVLGWDHSHIFNAAYVINLPSPMHGNKFTQGAVNGWTISGITQAQSGAPIQPNTGGTLNVQWPGTETSSRILGSNSYTLAPTLTCDPRSGLSSGQYFNPSCFSAPTGTKNGDVIWPYIKGPAFFNSDLAMFKSFKFREHQKIEFRFSAFNFLNHPLPQFGASGNSDIQLNFNQNNTLAAKNVNALTSGKPLFTIGRRVTEFTLKYNF